MRTITVAYPHGETVTVESGVLFAALAGSFEQEGKTIVAVRANNETQPLSAQLFVPAKLEPVFLESSYGASIYRHTLSFLLCAAMSKLFPDRHLQAGHSLGTSYYFSFLGGVPLSEDDIKRIKAALASLIDQNVPVTQSLVSFEEAVRYFKNVHAAEALELIEQGTDATVLFNTVQDYNDLYTGPLLPRTGLLSLFDVTLYQDGLLLRYPVFEEGELVLRPFYDIHGIFSVFRESKRAGRIAGVHAVSQLNALLIRRNIQEYIRISEAFAERKLSHIADMVHQRRGELKLITIAGPSSSGKTTTAKRLMIQLRTLGIEPVDVSLDDYYLHPDLVPKDEKGAPDFECLTALDIPVLNEHLLALFAGKEVTLPQFDFKSAVRRDGRRIKLGRRSILVIEGIHGLNDALTPEIPRGHKFKLYISALTQLNLDAHTRISTTDNRLLRRIVRDSRFRGVGAERTLRMWPSVQRGAEKYIFPFQNEACAVFNSALDYEIAVLKSYAEPLLRSVTPANPEFSEAARLLALLKHFLPVPSEAVPPLSILREFIGGSDFKY